MKIYNLIVFLVLCLQHGFTSRVLELTDKFPEIRKDGGLWLVKFYAPWCSHCKKLEPIWMHVAQALTKTNIRVGKVDVTRFPSVAYEFKAYATPSIKFIKPDSEHTYTGERSKDAISNYAIRMSRPPVLEVTRSESINDLKNNNKVFFMYVGSREGLVWDVFYSIAVNMQPYVFFYSTNEDIAKQHVKIENSPAVFVYKEDIHYFYQIEETEHLNETLHRWINEERFETFPKISPENINEYIQTRKNLVLVIVEENKIKVTPPEMLDFRNKVENLVRKKRDVYHKHFQFGWMGEPAMANSIAMARLPLPYLLVLNSSTYHHHIPEDDPPQMTIQAIEIFLEKIMNDTSPIYGGKSFIVNFQRKISDFIRLIEDMAWGENHSAIVVFTVPSLFFMVILYTCCCTNILDAEEDEDEELLFHEKHE